MSLRQLRQAMEAGGLRPLDYHFAAHLSKNLPADAATDALALAAAWVSHSLGNKAICVHLGEPLPARLFAQEGFDGIPTPDRQQWLHWLAASPRVARAGAGGQLVLDGQRLYLARYWHYESSLAQRLKQMAAQAPHCDSPVLLRQGLERLFSPRSQAAPVFDWQRLAAALAVLRPFVLISGGPGTGKTHTVAAILALLVEQARAADRPLRIALTAPTGKAAARLTESLRTLRDGLAVDEAVKQAIPAQAITLHRLIGTRPGRVEPRHHADNPLHLDLLVIDEASMIDLPLMYRSLAALPEGARLILLGDRDQLASVEAGSVFADLCGEQAAGAYAGPLLECLAALDLHPPPAPDQPRRPLDDGLVQLRESRRFAAHSGIGELAGAVNRADLSTVDALLRQGRDDLLWQQVDAQGLHAWLAQQALQAFAPVLQADSPARALDALNAFRILCAVREGPAGVAQVNALVERVLRRAGLVGPEIGRYRGRPLMVTSNDHGLGLFNGDVGILWPDAQDAMRAWFRLPDGGIRPVLPSRLPPHETAFALTVHKSQGSEFEHVLLLLPEHDSPVLTRELIYTGITRAVKAVTLRVSADILRGALQRKVHRASGLGARLVSAE
jgi:exodeoxyribonuclease V alpha subunit